MPKAKTKIGEQVEVTVEQCSEPECFQFPVTYDIHMDQIKALTEHSTICYQLVELSWFSTPLKASSIEIK